jgi:hypothetical protein
MLNSFKSKEKVSGLYKGVMTYLEQELHVELRVDVDGERPTNIISGDLFDEKTKYHFSFQFEDLRVLPTGSAVVITGKGGQFSSNINYFNDIMVTIPLGSNSGEAEAKWFTEKQELAKGICKFQSEFFRTVQVEHDYEEGVTPLQPYYTAVLPSPSQFRSRPLSIVEAYAEAGIKLIEKQKITPIPHPERTTKNGRAWTINMLNAAMTKHYNLLNDKTPWKIWLFSALEYVIEDTHGIMLEGDSKERLGCAVFQYATGWQSYIEQRMRLFIYVHEFGHCFNLPHTWNWPQSKRSTKSLQDYQTLSWMNYPWSYHSSGVCGEKGFWSTFNFQFSQEELIHLRHGFRNDVICGGNPNSNLATFSSGNC